MGGEISIFAACETGNLAKVREYLNDPSFDINAPDGNKIPLFVALQSNPVAIPIVELLLSHHDIDPNIICDGRTPLFHACSVGETEVVRILLKHPDTDPNFVVPASGKAPLHEACKNRHVEIVKLLLTHPSTDPTIRTKNFSGNAMMFACLEQSGETMKCLLEDGRLDPNAQDSQDMTVLHLSCKSGFEEITKILLQDPRTDPNILDQYERTPLISVARSLLSNTPAIFKLLLEDERTNVSTEEAVACLEICPRDPEIIFELAHLICSFRPLDPFSLSLPLDTAKRVELAIVRNSSKSARK